MLILEKNFKQNFIKTYCNTCQMVFKIMIKQHLSVSTESLSQRVIRSFTLTNSNIVIIDTTRL